ncbi:alxA [Symbiodinium sp. KB8]|nr:alxA [Symbiodinium sp. KB8]
MRDLPDKVFLCTSAVKKDEEGLNILQEDGDDADVVETALLKGVLHLRYVLQGYHVRQKVPALLEVLTTAAYQQAFVFVGDSNNAIQIAELLNQAGVPAAASTGKLDQAWRAQAFAGLKRFRYRVLVCTDLMARGIDAEKVDVVVNLDLPTEKETYLHRSGRTARFGSVGWMVSLVFEGDEAEHLEFFQKQLGFELAEYADREAAIQSRLEALSLPQDAMAPSQAEVEQFPQQPFPTPGTSAGGEKAKERGTRSSQGRPLQGPKKQARQDRERLPADPSPGLLDTTAIPPDGRGHSLHAGRGGASPADRSTPTATATHTAHAQTSRTMPSSCYRGHAPPLHGTGPAQASPGAVSMKGLMPPPILHPHESHAVPHIQVPEWQSWMLDCSFAKYAEQGSASASNPFLASLSSGTRQRLDALWQKHCDVWIGQYYHSLWAMSVRSKANMAGELKKPEEASLDLNHLITANRWSGDELAAVKTTHREPTDWVDWASYMTVRTLRSSFDLFSGYKFRTTLGAMHERDWLRRVIFLETVAGVPGMVAGMVRHLHSLRLMRRDHGWIHSLLAEAENERMHLLIALNLRRPGPVFRGIVIAGQGVFLTWYSLMYLVCPRYCHRFVGYLEEEAVITYSKLIDAIDADQLPMFSNMKAPLFARQYYNLPKEAMVRDVFLQIRADEACHRDTNHFFSDLKPDQPNTKVDHLRKGHFQNQNVHSGVLKLQREAQSKVMHETFQSLDHDHDGFISTDDLRWAFQQHDTPFNDEDLDEMVRKADRIALTQFDFVQKKMPPEESSYNGFDAFALKRLGWEPRLAKLKMAPPPASSAPSCMEDMLCLLEKYDRSSDGTIGEQELVQLVKALDKGSFWDEAKLTSLTKGLGLDAGRLKLTSFARMLFEGPQAALYQVVRQDLQKAMSSPEWDDGSYAPILIRLAWHSSGTYNKLDGTGGSNGATMRHALEMNDPENAYLEHARGLLEPVKAKHPWISHADLWILASYVALENTNGPRIAFTGGRVDAPEERAVAPGRLPGAEHGLAAGMEVDEEGRLKGWENLAQHIRDVFGRMGITDREAVALICGGHVYGRCHPESTGSGYAGAWVEMPTLFSNEYAADMPSILETSLPSDKHGAGMVRKWSDTASLMLLSIWAASDAAADPNFEVLQQPTAHLSSGSVYVFPHVTKGHPTFQTQKTLNDYSKHGVLGEVQAYNRQSTESVHRELCKLRQTKNLTAIFIQAGVFQKLGDDSCFFPPMRERYAQHLERNGVQRRLGRTSAQRATSLSRASTLMHSPSMPNPYGLLIVQHSKLRVCPIETRMPRGEGPMDQEYADEAYHRCKEGLDAKSNCSELLEKRQWIFAKRSAAVHQRLSEWFSANPGTLIAVLHPEFEKLKNWPSGVSVFRFLPTQRLESQCETRIEEAEHWFRTSAPPPTKAEL